MRYVKSVAGMIMPLKKTEKKKKKKSDLKAEKKNGQNYLIIYTRVHPIFTTFKGVFMM